MQLDYLIVYAELLATHGCDCGGRHVLRTYPVDAGFAVAVCCDTCRDRNGLPTRYSTETGVFPTFDAAERSREALMRVAEQVAA